MKAVMLMFDSLNRDYLPNYGCDWTKLPNFSRLEEHCTVYDQFYAGSLPCMPARRELHTGRYSFLHRGWGPLEPFDVSMIDGLKKAGVYTHLTSDHSHYWEDGGATYHTRYNTWQCNRGQEGDPWMGQVRDPIIPAGAVGNKVGTLWRQDWVNRTFQQNEAQLPQTRTVDDGLDFIVRNAQDDRWFLQMELFDPHEPYFTPDSYKALYPHHYQGAHLDWPDYGPNAYSPEETAHLRMEYAALLSLCDHSLGRLLDLFDEQDLWKDTMLILNTDHGFMLGEKNWMGKNMQPCYNEVVHTPFFLWDPRFPNATGRRKSLAQTIDIAPTLLGFFGAPPLENVDGRDLAPVQRDDEAVRQAALFGVHGGHVNVTDGRATLMRAPVSAENGPLYEYTLMPTHMNARFSVQELQSMTLCSTLQFPGCPVLKIPAASYVNAYWYGDLLFDVEADPQQTKPLNDLQKTVALLNALCDLMRKNEAPAEQFARLGLPVSEPVTAAWLLAEGKRQAFTLPAQLAALPLTPGGTKAIGILLSLAPPPMHPQLIAGLASLAQNHVVQVDEHTVTAVLEEALPPAFGKMLPRLIRGYLLYETEK